MLLSSFLLLLEVIKIEFTSDTAFEVKSKVESRLIIIVIINFSFYVSESGLFHLIMMCSSWVHFAANGTISF